MSNQLGSDPEQLDRLARLLTSAAGEVGRVRSTVTGRLDALFWQGPDADNFKASWNSVHNEMLRQAGSKLGVAAEDLRRQAITQRQVSR